MIRSGGNSAAARFKEHHTVTFLNMLKWLFVFPLIAFIDPLLLYWIWPYLTLAVKVGILIAYPFLASLYLLNRPVQVGDVFTRPLRIGIRIGAWYPGPISKVLSLVLLYPPIERVLVRTIVQRLQQHILKGVNIPPGATPPNSPTFESAPSPGDDKLKRARGRVIE